MSFPLHLGDICLNLLYCVIEIFHLQQEGQRQGGGRGAEGGVKL